MAREQNIFHNLVTDENSTTEVLCNLMQFTAFRRLLLAKLLPGLPETCASQISFDDIDTQARFDDCGQPDLIIKNDVLYALVEVKIYPFRAPTVNQPNGYFKVLTDDKDKTPERWLVFLVPKGWEYRQCLNEDLKKLKDDYHDGIIHTHVAEWEDVLAVIEDNDLQNLNPFLNDFYQMFDEQFRPKPIKFNQKELSMLFSKDFPAALSKLDNLICKIKEMSTAYNYQSTWATREKKLCPNDGYALEFCNAQGQKVLWFGVWTDFWMETGYPLCFGVWDGFDPAIQAAFKEIYHGDTKYGGHWTMGWISKETLEGENAVEEVWKQLAPVLKAVVKAV